MIVQLTPMISKYTTNMSDHQPYENFNYR